MLASVENKKPYEALKLLTDLSSSVRPVKMFAWLQDQEGIVQNSDDGFNNFFGKKVKKACSVVIMKRRQRCSCCVAAKVLEQMMPIKCVRCSRHGRIRPCNIYHFPYMTPEGEFMVLHVGFVGEGPHQQGEAIKNDIDKREMSSGQGVD